MTFNIVDATFNLVEFTRDSLSISVGANGVLSAPASINLYTASSFNQTAIGAEDGDTGSFFKGDIVEIVILPVKPTLDIQQRIEGYLMHKYLMSSMLPANHPYRYSPPTT